MKPHTAADFQTDMRGADPRMIELAYLQAHLDPIDDVLVQSQPLAGIIFTEQGPMEVAPGDRGVWRGDCCISREDRPQPEVDGLSRDQGRAQLLPARLAPCCTWFRWLGWLI